MKMGRLDPPTYCVSAYLSCADLRLASPLEFFLDFFFSPAVVVVDPFLFLDDSACCFMAACCAIAFCSSWRSAAMKFEYSDALDKRKSS